MANQDYHFDTKRIHAGYSSEDHFNAVNTPIYQTAAFDLADIDRARRLWTGAESAGLYTRVGNPTVTVLEQRITELDGGSAAIGLASGMAAISYTVLLLGEGGGNIVSASSLYGAAQESLTHFFPKFGITTRFVKNRNDATEYESLIDENTKAIYIESISNPNIEVYDFEAIAEVAHKHGIPVVVDNTIATPYLFRPFEHGADLIVYSATKGIAGHGNTIAGLVVEKGGFEYSKERFPQFHTKSYKMRDLQGNPRTPLEFAPDSPFVASLRIFYLEFIGATLGAFDAFLVLQGLSTLSERLEKQVATTKKLVEYLENKKEVEWVRHPFAKDSAYKELADKYFPNGAGAVFSFGFGGTRDQFKKFITSLEVLSYHVNIGDVRTLIANPPETTHTELEPHIQELADIPSNLVRISVGLENADDLIADFEQAFEKAFS
ncbi:MAG: O-acetylhomoserine aminocarboxypropyltransferase/cysteine synthase [Lachnospiraceae bacterium]|nr:O-acetylhomoserine aminocarboxypropyltransferase/cysteine synthase [Lachnospiraceae bacterium]